MYNLLNQTDFMKDATSDDLDFRVQTKARARAKASLAVANTNQQMQLTPEVPSNYDQMGDLYGTNRSK